jgi:hypothetical protein
VVEAAVTDDDTTAATDIGVWTVDWDRPSARAFASFFEADTESSICTSMDGNDPSGPLPPPSRRGEKGDGAGFNLSCSVRATVLLIGAADVPRGRRTTLAFCNNKESSSAILNILWQNRSSGTFDKAA